MKPQTALDKLPHQLLDDEGYPTNEWIEFIETYVPDESLPIEKFVKNVFVDGWWMPDWGFKLKRKYRGVIKLSLHTGGWSGNEDVIRAIKSNLNLTCGRMQLVCWKAGGHYYFEIDSPIK
jgi:hypothetical protein